MIFKVVRLKHVTLGENEDGEKTVSCNIVTVPERDLKRRDS